MSPLVWVFGVYVPLPFAVIGLIALDRWIVGKVRRRRMERCAQRGLTAKDREWAQHIGGVL